MVKRVSSKTHSSSVIFVSVDMTSVTGKTQWALSPEAFSS